MNSFFQWLVRDDWFFVSPLDWLIIILPVSFVLFMAWYSRRYVVQVSDFLSAGRLCGRYLISVADIANGLSIIGLVAYVEVHYRTGFALTFWQILYQERILSCRHIFGSLKVSLYLLGC